MIGNDEMNHGQWDVFSDRTIDRTPGPLVPDWASVDQIVAAYSAVLGTYQSEIDALLATWNRELESFGGDPSTRDWRDFRPLRLSREEDWADWLAFLIRTSATGVFSRWLFGGDDGAQFDYASPKAVEREVSSQGYRADLMIQWNNDSYAHMEVKVGDENLSKTYDTGRVMRAKYGAPTQRWYNFILLLPHQLSAWDELEPIESAEPAIVAVTWASVSIALRRGLRSDEDVLWKACAYMFVGAMEQFLVGYPGYRDSPRPIENVGVKMWILREGLRCE